jgi:hypothetical protein
MTLTGPQQPTKGRDVMGVFDYIRVKMPLPALPLPPDIEWFQTKDVPTDQLWLLKWTIEEDGCLIRHGYHIEDRGDKGAPEGSIERVAGCMTTIYDPALDEAVDFHGDIAFGHYDDKTGGDWGYVARFTNGRCVNVWLDNYEQPKPSPSNAPD